MSFKSGSGGAVAVLRLSPFENMGECNAARAPHCVIPKGALTSHTHGTTAHTHAHTCTSTVHTHTHTHTCTPLILPNDLFKVLSERNWDKLFRWRNTSVFREQT